MEILDVIPLKRGIGKEVLSYFSSHNVPLGAMVEVPLRKKTETALVVAKHDPKKLKTHLKTSNYQLKNIKGVREDTLFSSAFIKAAVHMKNYYVSTTGNVLAAYTPTALLSEDITYPLSPQNSEEGENLMPEKYVLQKEWPERIEYYKTYIRESFAAKESIFITVPTRAEGEELYQALSESNTEYTYLIHSELPAKKQRQIYTDSIKNEHPVVIVGTPLYLLLPREDIGTVVVESEASPYYKKQKRPYTDDRDMAYVYAHVKNCKYIAADTLVQLKTLQERDSSVLQDAAPLSFRMKHMTRPSIITSPDDSEETTKKKKKKQSSIERLLHPSTVEAINNWIKDKKPFCVFVPRKGLAPITTCNDCNSVVSNPSTGTPLVLSLDTKNGNRYYKDPYTRDTFEITDTCSHCGGWRLETLGIGTEGMEEFLQKKYKKLHIETITADDTPTYTKAKKALSNTIENSGVVIATEKITTLLGYKSLPAVAVPSLASLFARPSYTLYEDVMRTLLTLGEGATEELLIQSKDEHNPVLEAVSKQNLIDWYRNEMSERKEFNYPPYNVLIKISVAATNKTSIPKKRERITKLLSGYDVLVDEEKNKHKKGYTVICTLKVSASDWIAKTGARHGLPETYKDLFKRLQSLPQQYAIEINPRSLI